MKLERLVLENFRQFKGRQELIFSDLVERNITLVHAENGFGKTTLLKALLWALYGYDGLMGTDGQEQDFEKPEAIIHEGVALAATDPNEVKAEAQLTFKHDDARYILTRSLTLLQQNLDPKKPLLSLEVMRDGQTYQQDRPQQWIQSIVPSAISKFLFFNGERINYLAAEKNSAKVTEAIEQMLGLSLLRQTIDDLKHQNVRGRLKAELRDCASKEKADLLQQQVLLEEKIEADKEAIKQVELNLSAAAKELSTINAKLAANREAADLQLRRQGLVVELETLTARRDQSTQRIAKLIAEDGYTLFTENLVTRGEEVVSRLRSEGKIPAKVLNSFLEELLQRGLCICERHLPEGSSERKAVENLLAVAGDADFNNAVGALDHAIGLLKGLAPKTRESLNQLNTERLELISQIRELGEEIETIHQQLGGKDDEEIQALEEQHKKLELRQHELHSERGRFQGAVDAAQKDVDTLQTQIRQLTDKEEAAARAQRRLDAVDDCGELLERILEEEVQELRPMLNDEINQHFRRIMTKSYWAELGADYTLRIKKQIVNSDNIGESTETSVALSTGERTVTSLVFIASLVALAKRRSKIPTILKGLSGSTYPIAIDSPFGSLSIFREGVARDIPELAPQVLLLVSPEQYNGAVEKALNTTNRVGKRYYLAYHGPTIPENANPSLLVNGEEIQQYFPDKHDEYTELVEM